MGGSIGITLFIGTALSIALYIVGFSESFLGITAISDFLGLQADINGIRIVGSAILVLLVIIAFISTSLAIKSQFIVLGAIILSLLSIAAGFFFGDQTAIQTNFTAPADGHVSMITIFAIFFPAVTGFTAGVAMSGDLEDPKKSIPKGTLLSILTGLVVYIGLAVGFAYFVDRDLLINDTTFINKIAFWSWPVIAGIWGATLSSALGGILGAPRIMQAISKDKIMPRILGKGYGPTNEPRNALIFTFLLAELGVLMGELDAIAEVVSMFYIAAYGFINMAFALESWANTDFRPSFKISRWVGIIGFLASFGVMLQLNPAAMFAAFVIMWVIYFILKRRELKSDFGDVWASVWSSIVRTSLNKLSEKQLTEQNWTPNILLFSGGSKNRPYLIDFGKQLVGKYGFLSNFDLVVRKENEDLLFARTEQMVKDLDTQKNQGFFTRRQSCTDIYSGIEQVAANYGFAGIEPNTVFMGWPRNTKEPHRFMKLLRNIHKLDLNIVMMDYDHKRGFGNYKQIDVWWRGGGQNGNFSLQLIKFILQSENWNNAHVRLIIVNPVNEMHEQIYRKAEKILNNLRMEAEIKIINNQIDRRSFYDIVQIESVNSDLIFMGVESVEETEVESFMNRINTLCEHIGTVILTASSTHFKELKIGLESSEDTLEHHFKINLHSKIKTEDLAFPKYQSIADANKELLGKLLEENAKIKADYLEFLLGIEDKLAVDLKNIMQKHFDSIKQSLLVNRIELVRKKVHHTHSQFLLDSQALIEDFKKAQLDKEKEYTAKLIKNTLEHFTTYYQHLPKHIEFTYTLEDMLPEKDDLFDVRWFKRWNRFLGKFGKKHFHYKLEYRNLLIQHSYKTNLEAFRYFLNELGTNSIRNIADLSKNLVAIDLIFQEVTKDLTQNNKTDIEQLSAKYKKQREQLSEAFEINKRDLLDAMDQMVLQIINHLNGITSMVHPNALIDEEFNYKKAFKNPTARFEHIPSRRKRNQILQINSTLLNLNILNFSNRLKQITLEIERYIDQEVQKGLLNSMDKYIDYLERFLQNLQAGTKKNFDFNIDELNTEIDQNFADRMINMNLRRLKSAVSHFPESIELFTEESDNMLGTNQYGELETIQISVTALLDYMIQNNFNGNIKAILDEVPNKIMDYQNQLLDQYRLTTYSFEDSTNDSSQQSRGNSENEQLILLIESQLKNLKSDREEVIQLKENFKLRIEERLHSALNSISFYPFIKAAANLRQYIRHQQTKNHFGKLKDWNKTAKKWLQDQFAQLWYRQSQGVILTQELIEADESIQQNQLLRDLHRKLYSGQAIYDKLPFYYRQLFLRKHNFMKEMWVERPAEMELGRRCLEDFRNGIKGGILVVGPHYSGKSFYIQMLAHEYTTQENIITINPPAGGSTDKKVFIEQFKLAAETNFGIEHYLRNAKGKVVIVFEDLELWWEKTPEGFNLITYIHELIHRFSHKVLFISSLNIHSYKVMNRVLDIEVNYLNVIAMGAMNAKQLNEMIIKRHNTGTLKFILNKKKQEQFHTWDYARLFNSYFNFSRGIPGIAIYAWVNNITKVNEKEIKIKYPESFDIEAFEYFDADQNWLLLQFVLHKTMDIEKLVRLSGMTRQEAILDVEKLVRNGIVTKTDENVFKINVLMYHLVMQHLENNRLL
jgi:amino acid transporter/archaellum biogenesis ATPase FlaH